jgi:hypothetical protein
MTTKTLTGTYSSGFLLQSGYSALTLTATGSVGGFGLLTNEATSVSIDGHIAATDPGSYGLDAEAHVSLTTAANSSISGAVGLAGQSNGQTGGVSGVGVYLAAYGAINNAGEVFGGGGATGGPGYAGGSHGPAVGGGAGGDGAAALDIKSGQVTNSGGVFEGGQGGRGGNTGNIVGSAGFGGNGGDGGAGVLLGGSGSIVNNGGDLYGGFGGAGGSGRYAGNAGRGGAAVVLDAGGYVYTHGGLILGGFGLAAASGANGGAGGEGVLLKAGGTVTAYGAIRGGAGGAGGNYALGGNGGAGVLSMEGAIVTVLSGAAIVGGAGGKTAKGDVGGDGGAGILLESVGTVSNYGAITGGNGGSGGTGVYGESDTGGVGVDLGPGATLNNDGTITGGQGATAALGGHGVNMLDGGRVGALGTIVGSVGVYVDSGGPAEVDNYGVIQGLSGVSVDFNSTADTLRLLVGSSLIGTAEGAGGTLQLGGGFAGPASDTITGMGGLAQLSGSATGDVSNFASYVVFGGDALTLTGSNAIGVGGSLTIDDGGTLSAQGGVANSGLINLESTGDATDLNILAAGATLSGGGVVSLGGAAVEIVGASATATLTNAGDTLSGVGAIGDGKLTLVNETAGVIEAVGAGKLVVNTRGETMTNAGLIEATTGGTLEIGDTTIDQLHLGDGQISAAGGRIYLEADHIVGGSVGSTGAGLVEFNLSGGELDGTFSAITVGGAVRVVNGVSLSLAGGIDITGKLEVEATTQATDLIIAAGVSLTGGQIDLSNSADNTIVGAAATDTLTNVSDHIVGAGLLGDGALTLVNDKAGAIYGNQTVALTINTGAKAITNAGLIEADGKGGVVVDSAVTNTGKLEAIIGTLTLKGAVTGAGLGYVDGGTLYAASTFTEAVDFLGTTGVLELARSAADTGKITGLSKTGTNSLDLLDIAFGTKTKAIYSGTTTSGTLSVTDGTHTAKITLEGNYTASTFKVSSDGHGGTKVVDPTAPPHAFIAAMAGFGARGGTATSMAEPWRNPAASLALPHAA